MRAQVRGRSGFDQLPLGFASGGQCPPYASEGYGWLPL